MNMLMVFVLVTIETTYVYPMYRLQATLLEHERHSKTLVLKPFWDLMYKL